MLNSTTMQSSVHSPEASEKEPIRVRACQNRTLRFWWIVALFVVAGPSNAQDISPQPATPEDEIRLFFAFPVVGCFNEITDVAVSTNGTLVSVDFVVEEVALPICGTPPPLILDVALGSFPPGDYQVALGGVILGDPFGPITTGFGVQGGGSSVGLPVLSEAGLWLLLLVISVAAVLVLPSRR